MRQRGLLMDLDGTIADTLPHLFKTFRYAVEPFVESLPSDAEIVATFGPAERECITRLLAKARFVSSFDQTLETATARFHDYYESRHHEVKVFPGISEAIQFARERGWTFGVFTGKGRRSAVFTLEQLGLWQYVDCLITSDDITHPKPHPEGVELAMRQLALTAKQMLVVGDAPADVLAGKAAGAWTAAALWGAFDRDATRKTGPTWELEAVNDLLDILASQLEN